MGSKALRTGIPSNMLYTLSDFVADNIGPASRPDNIFVSDIVAYVFLSTDTKKIGDNVGKMSLTSFYRFDMSFRFCRRQNRQMWTARKSANFASLLRALSLHLLNADLHWHRLIITFPPLIGGGIKRCFCLTSIWRLTSVCLSVAYIGPNIIQRGLGRPKLPQR